MLARFVFDAATQLGVPAVDVAWLLERLFTLLACCDERRVEQWDRQSWWDYVQADERSEAFRRYLADGLTRTLVAARAKEMSARTGGLVLVQLLLDLSRAGDAPTACSTRRPRTPGSRRGSRTCAAAGSTCGWARPSRAVACATAGSRRRTVGGHE